VQTQVQLQSMLLILTLEFSTDGPDLIGFYRSKDYTEKEHGD